MYKISFALFGALVLSATGPASAGEKVLYSFQGESDGAEPFGRLVKVGGVLYGTTTEGGLDNCSPGTGCGTVFKILKTGIETVLYRFAGGSDGSYPSGGLTNVGGTLYGATVSGGAYSQGTVFSLTTDGTETVLHAFGSSGDGIDPAGSLLVLGGIIYGNTEAGGSLGLGTVFELTKAGVETRLHSFLGQNFGDGAYSFSGLLDVGGTFYGTTEAGGAGAAGTVFSVTGQGTESVLHSFGLQPSDGSGPGADLANLGGTIYGITLYGGANGLGTVFSVTLAGVETVLHSFQGAGDGANPYGLVAVGGVLYGTTESGGGSHRCPNGCGTIFKVTTAGVETVVHAFRGGKDGAVPTNLVAVGSDLYGTTANGGAYGKGTVFKLTP